MLNSHQCSSQFQEKISFWQWVLLQENFFQEKRRIKEQPLHGDNAMLCTSFWQKKKNHDCLCEWGWEGGKGRVLWGDLKKREREEGS